MSPSLRYLAERLARGEAVPLSELQAATRNLALAPLYEALAEVEAGGPALAPLRHALLQAAAYRETRAAAGSGAGPVDLTAETAAWVDSKIDFELKRPIDPDAGLLSDPNAV